MFWSMDFHQLSINRSVSVLLLCELCNRSLQLMKVHGPKCSVTTTASSVTFPDDTMLDNSWHMTTETLLIINRLFARYSCTHALLLLIAQLSVKSQQSLVSSMYSDIIFFVSELLLHCTAFCIFTEPLLSFLFSLASLLACFDSSQALLFQCLSFDVQYLELTYSRQALRPNIAALALV